MMSTRRFLATVAAILFVAIVTAACGAPTDRIATSNAELASSTSIAPSTPLPADFSLIPAFNPAYNCELQTTAVHDEQLCRNERLVETAISDSDHVLFLHDYRVATGCWGSIQADTRELRVCDKKDGQVTTLAENVSADPIPSPDGTWFAFSVIDFKPPETAARALVPHIYLIDSEGANLQQLDTQELPSSIVGVRIVRWSADSKWLEVALWDGTTDGWHDYRIKTDGNGEYEQIL